MAVTQARHIPSENISSDHTRVPGPTAATVSQASQRHSDPDESQVLSTLRELVAAGEHRLDPMLAAIADGALLLTGATGVALAMWKDGAMVCRARSGATAPPLGAQLSADKGISGECLRTGKTQHCVDTEKNRLVDVEVCRTLGLRSIAVLPVQGWRGVNGILEAFSTEPAAFSPHHLAVLEQLAGLAERARAAKPVGASPTTIAQMGPVGVPVEKSEPAGLLPASDRFVDFVRALVGRRPLVLGALGLAMILLLGLVIWLGWRGNDGSENKARAAEPASVLASSRAPASSVVSSGPLPGDAQTSEHSPTDRLKDQHVAGQHVPDNDSVWKPNPGGQTLLISSGKPSAARTLKAAAELDAAEIRKNKNHESPTLPASDATGAQQPAPGSNPASTSGSNTAAGNNPSTAPHRDETSSLGPPPLPADQPSSALNGVLASKPLVPSLSPQRVSQGVSGGQLIHRVPPIYPLQAKSLRMEGKVVLDATVMEDGSVGDLKVVQGPAIFTSAAVEAVKKWRYKPFVLDGKAVKSPMRIMVDFKLPGTR
ncbi:MAG: TonB family protein [Terriglobales bacterium]